MWWLLMIFLASIGGMWHSFDSIRIALFSGNLSNFTINEVEQNGIGDERFVQIDKVVWDGSMVYEAKPLPNGEIGQLSEVKTVILPLMSIQEFGLRSQNFKSKIKVLVKYEMPNHTILADLKGENPLEKLVTDKSKISLLKRKNWMPEKTTEFGEEFSVSGLTQVGLNSIDKESKNLIASLNHEISPDLVFIDVGSKPSSLTYGLLIFSISLIGFATSSFFGFAFVRNIFNYLKNGSDTKNDDELISLS